MAQDTPVLLTDEQMRRFITEGFLLLRADFAPEFHQKLAESLHHVYQSEGNPGNNLLPRVREVQKIFEHPVITGALTSVLGPEYVMHAHRHGHYNADPKPGRWHKDSYWGYGRMRNHHPWWAMIMYFPQDTPVELGPTAVMPGTQYYDTRVFASDDPVEEALASGEAGTFALIHYDIWHRSTANVLNQPRYMLKFEFMRTQAPESPSWACRAPGWRPPDSADALPGRHDILWEEIWNWLAGRTGSLAGTLPGDPASVADLARQLETAPEPDALNAAYALACCGQGGIKRLLGALSHDNTAVSRLAGYGLSAAGADAVHGLTVTLDSPSEDAVMRAVFALGELGRLAKGAVPRLNALLRTAPEKVRREIVEALGRIGSPADATVSGLIDGLRDPDVQVRFMAGLSLSRLGTAAEPALHDLQTALDDENRYVRAHAAEALRSIGTEPANQILIRELFNLRWCSNTTPTSAFYP